MARKLARPILAGRKLAWKNGAGIARRIGAAAIAALALCGAAAASEDCRLSDVVDLRADCAERGLDRAGLFRALGDLTQTAGEAEPVQPRALLNALRRVNTAGADGLAAISVSQDGTYVTGWYCGALCAETLEDLRAIARASNAYCTQKSIGENPCRLWFAGAVEADPRANPRSGETRLSVRRGAGAPDHGPMRAAGLLYVLPGYDGWPDAHPPEIPSAAEDGLWALHRALNRRGWDVRRVNLHPFDRLETWRDEAFWAQALRKLVERGRDRGYERIAFAGQSRGAAELLWGLQADVGADAALLFEPSFRGPLVERDGSPSPRAIASMGELVALIEGATAPRLLTAAFAGSRFTRGLTPERLAGVAAQKPLLALSEPPHLAGHGAAAGLAFAERYTACVDALLRGDAAAPGFVNCAPEPAIRGFGDKAEILAAGGAPMSGRALIGRTLCLINLETGREIEDCVYFQRGLRIVAPAPNTPSPDARYAGPNAYNIASVAHDDAGYCKADGFAVIDRECFDLFRFGDEIQFANRATGAALGRWRFRADQTARLPARDYACVTRRVGKPQVECWRANPDGLGATPPPR